MTGNKKIALLGGGGVRTPLLIHGLAQSRGAIGARELALYDIDSGRAALMEALGREIARDSGLRITTAASVTEAVDGAAFVLSSLRVGGIEARARDERIAIEHGMAGQETTGPGGLAMALRTIPVALEHARTIEQYARAAWLINFTNPAGLMTQALMSHSGARVIGICDTPAELFHRIAWSLSEPVEDVECKYSGLNHLGWVRNVLLRGEDITARLLRDDAALLRLYPADLFDPALIRALGLIPTEYLFFYYSRTRAFNNQRTTGSTRGEEIARLNSDLLRDLAREVAQGQPRTALVIYKSYLNRRNSSYMRLEANAESAFSQGEHDWDPFEGATGYHRIAIDVMTALSSRQPAKVVVNVRNDRAIQDFAPDDVVEVPCLIDEQGAVPLEAGCLPEVARGLALAVKEYERLAIRAVVERSFDLARLALFINPLVGGWEAATNVLKALLESDAEHLGYLR